MKSSKKLYAYTTLRLQCCVWMQEFDQLVNDSVLIAFCDINTFPNATVIDFQQRVILKKSLYSSEISTFTYYLSEVFLLTENGYRYPP